MSENLEKSAQLPDLPSYASLIIESYFPEEAAQVLEKLTYAWNGRFRGRTAGVCRFEQKKKELRPFKIELSSKYMILYPEMLDTILLHEMIHALLPFDVKHGRKFQSFARQLEAIYLKKTGATIQITTRLPEGKQFPRDYKYTYQCVKCGQAYRRVQNPLNTARYVCGRCGGKIKEDSK